MPRLFHALNLTRTRRVARAFGLSGALAGAAVLGSPLLHAQGTPFDHSAFDALLKAHVVDGMVDYGAFKNAPSFAGYLTALSKQDPATLPRPEQLAFWINAYNAYTIQLINKHGETKSIRNINKTLGLKLKGPWGEPLANVGGKFYTLDDIEHVIIRPTYKEPRIHFALVCAAMGCPPLRSEAFTGARLESQLDDQGLRFITKSPTKNRVDVSRNTFYHSMIFGYYKADFGGSVAASGKYAAKWFPAGSPERALLERGTFKAVETEYDWTLNSQTNARRLAPK
ncbi:MAG: DUF547 domain-containing protein [Gemmatimonadaceae bacterium]|nr:DUF547 domain-containing protein [Gemmatimonadaceae bacterium]